MRKIIDSQWSGVVVADAGGGIFSVSGHWTVPDINPTVSGTSSCYIWIGIGGYHDGTSLLQAGISCDVEKGKPVFNAWWEWTPDVVRLLPPGSFSVMAKDEIVCTISGRIGTGVATISLQNLRTQKFANFGNPVKAIRGAVLQGNNAEWVVEAPVLKNGQATLSNYGQVQFSECNSNGKAFDPSKSTSLTWQFNGQVSTGSSPGPGQVTCVYGQSATGTSGLAPRVIASRALPSSNIITAR